MQRPDHPRACGENLPPAPATVDERGSPPRVRGKLPLLLKLGKPPRITPARAGKTWAKCRPPRWRRDHPRACGENSAYASRLATFIGSPPRVRGKPSGLILLRPPMRITPARAGKTNVLNSIMVAPPDHPRACGENPWAVCGLVALAGSPPRVRGKHPLLLKGSAFIGITPARAGKTVCSACVMDDHADHPRACGENHTSLRSKDEEHGSPPRVRGKPSDGRRDERPLRITPARAGKTW